MPDTVVVGDPDDQLPLVLYSSLYIDGEAVVGALDREGYAVASGSACASSTARAESRAGSHGVLTHGNVRVTLRSLRSPPAVEFDVADFCAAIAPTVAAVRAELGVGDL